MATATLNGISYEELENSPTFAGGRDGPSAQRKFKVAWSDKQSFVGVFFPAAIQTGKGWTFPISLAFPGMPWMSAQAFKCDPWDPTKTIGYDSSGVRSYDWAAITIDYKAPEYDKSDDGKDPAKDGDQILADHSLAFSAEMLKLGISGWKWQGLTKTGDIIEQDMPIKNEETSLVKLVPQIEHTLTWNYVPYPPFQTIAQSVGCINSDTKLFYAAGGTLMFVGAEIKRSYHSVSGDESWKVTYKFLQRCIRDKILGTELDTAGQGEIGDVTWNHLYRNDAGMWDAPLRPDGSSIYSYVAFSDLFKSDGSDDTK